MLYIVIEKYKNKEEVYRRFREKGRMMPEGVSYVNSWVTADGSTCYLVNEAKVKNFYINGRITGKML